jgi:hypothetical protein
MIRYVSHGNPVTTLVEDDLQAEDAVLDGHWESNCPGRPYFLTIVVRGMREYPKMRSISFRTEGGRLHSENMDRQESKRSMVLDLGQHARGQTLHKTVLSRWFAKRPDDALRISRTREGSRNSSPSSKKPSACSDGMGSFLARASQITNVAKISLRFAGLKILKPRR